MNRQSPFWPTPRLLSSVCPRASALGRICALVVSLVLVGLVGCGAPRPGGSTPDFCQKDADCGAQSACLNQICVASLSDAGAGADLWKSVPPHECSLKDTRECDTGQPGVCAQGERTCIPGPGGHGAVWGECIASKKPEPERCGDKLDNDCNGKADEGCQCTPGQVKKCYGDIPRENRDVGACQAGEQRCGQDYLWGSCQGVQEPTKETCDGVDNDCDGQTDEELGGEPCPLEQLKGNCSTGETRCLGGKSECVQTVFPKDEKCGDGDDDNCDGVIDDGCQCQPGAAQSCYTKTPENKRGKGLCQPGTQICNEQHQWGDCKGGDYQPTAELCDGKDNDCDGQTDNGFEKKGQACTVGVGACQAKGTYVCAPDQKGVECNAKAGQPLTELCNGFDDDCDGSIDEIFRKKGLPCAAGLGECRSPGTYICNAQGDGVECNAKAGQPLTEVCDGKDNDCDGPIDNMPGTRRPLQRSCYSGPSGTENTGECKSGVQYCALSRWTRCNEVKPKTEMCNGKDDDCDGSIDEGFSNCGQCTPGKTMVCYDGPSGSEKHSPCKTGTKTCLLSGAWSRCIGQALPEPEVCDGKDNDCDGFVDEICGARHNYIAFNSRLDAKLHGFKKPMAVPTKPYIQAFERLSGANTDPCGSEVVILTTRSHQASMATYECNGTGFQVYTATQGSSGDLNHAPVPFHAVAPTTGLYGYVRCSKTTSYKCSVVWSNKSGVNVVAVDSTSGVVTLHADECKTDFGVSHVRQMRPFFATLRGRTPGYIQTRTEGTVKVGTPNETGSCMVQTFDASGRIQPRSFAFWIPPKDKAVWARADHDILTMTYDVTREVADYSKQFLNRWGVTFGKDANTGASFTSMHHDAWVAPSSLVITTPLFHNVSGKVPYLSTFNTSRTTGHQVDVLIHGLSNATGTLAHSTVRSPYAILYGRP